MADVGLPALGIGACFAKMWNLSGFDARSSCFHMTVAAIGKPGRARGEYVPMAVVPRPFLKWSMKSRRGRFAPDLGHARLRPA
jgi:hypothetical protein